MHPASHDAARTEKAHTQRERSKAPAYTLLTLLEAATAPTIRHATHVRRGRPRRPGSSGDVAAAPTVAVSRSRARGRALGTPARRGRLLLGRRDAVVLGLRFG